MHRAKRSRGVYPRTPRPAPHSPELSLPGTVVRGRPRLLETPGSLPFPAWTPGVYLASCFLSGPEFKRTASDHCGEANASRLVLTGSLWAGRVRPPLRLAREEGGGFYGVHSCATPENTSSSEREGHRGGRARGRGGLPYLEPYKAPLKAFSDVPSPGGRGGVIIIKQHLHRDFIYKALSQGREALGWPCGMPAGRPWPGPRVGSAPSPARKGGRGKQSSIHPATSDSSGFHPLFPLSHEELT